MFWGVAITSVSYTKGNNSIYWRISFTGSNVQMFLMFFNIYLCLKTKKRQQNKKKEKTGKNYCSFHMKMERPNNVRHCCNKRVPHLIKRKIGRWLYSHMFLFDFSYISLKKPITSSITIDTVGNTLITCYLSCPHFPQLLKSYNGCLKMFIKASAKNMFLLFY